MPLVHLLEEMSLYTSVGAVQLPSRKFVIRPEYVPVCEAVQCMLYERIKLDEQLCAMVAQLTGRFEAVLRSVAGDFEQHLLAALQLTMGVFIAGRGVIHRQNFVQLIDDIERHPSAALLLQTFVRLMEVVFAVDLTQELELVS